MTGGLHVTEGIQLPTPRSQWLAVIPIGKMLHSMLEWASEAHADKEQG